MSTPVAVYRCFDADGRLLYVGQSNDSARRIHGYRKEGRPWVEQIDRVTHEWYQHRTDALLAERRATHDENPLHPTDVDSITAGEEATFSLAQDLKNVGYSHPRAWHIAKKLLTKCGYLTGGQTPVHGPLTDEQRERLTRPRRAAS